MQGTPQDIEDFVPDYLREVLRIAKTCSDKASDVEKQFEKVMSLIGELQEACTVAKGSYEEKLRIAEAKQNTKKERIEKAKNEEKRLKEEYNQMKERLQEADKVFKKVMESDASLGMKAGLQMMQGVIGAVTAPLNFLNPRNFVQTQMACGSSEPDLKRQQKQVLEKEEVLQNELAGINTCIGNLLETAKKFTVVAADNAAVPRTVEQELLSLEVNLGDKFDQLNRYKGHHVERVKKLTENSQKILLIIKESRKNLCEDEITKNSKRKQVEQLTEELECALEAINAHMSTMGSTMPIENPSPRLDKMVSSCSDAIQSHDQTIRMKLETAQTGLQAAKDDFKEASKKMCEANEQITNSIEELGKINLDKINFDDIKKLLMRNLKILGKVKTEWGKLVRFFQKIANIIEFAMEENVKKFVSDAGKIQQRAIEYKLSDMHRDILYQNANNANKLAFVVSNLSGMYCDVSDNHIMDQIASLGQLMALDPEKERKAIESKQGELEQQAKAACSSIKDIVTNRMTDFEKKVNQRMTAIENQMKVVMPVVEENPRVRAARNEAIAESNQIKADVRKKENEDYFNDLNADDW